MRKKASFGLDFESNLPPRGAPDLPRDWAQGQGLRSDDPPGAPGGSRGSRGELRGRQGRANGAEWTTRKGKPPTVERNVEHNVKRDVNLLADIPLDIVFDIVFDGAGTVGRVRPGSALPCRPVSPRTPRVAPCRPRHPVSPDTG